MAANPPPTGRETFLRSAAPSVRLFHYLTRFPTDLPNPCSPSAPLTQKPKRAFPRSAASRSPSSSAAAAAGTNLLPTPRLPRRAHTQTGLLPSAGRSPSFDRSRLPARSHSRRKLRGGANAILGESADGSGLAAEGKEAPLSLWRLTLKGEGAGFSFLTAAKVGIHSPPPLPPFA